MTIANNCLGVLRRLVKNTIMLTRAADAGTKTPDAKEKKASTARTIPNHQPTLMGS